MSGSCCRRAGMPPPPISANDRSSIGCAEPPARPRGPPASRLTRTSGAGMTDQVEDGVGDIAWFRIVDTGNSFRTRGRIGVAQRGHPQREIDSGTAMFDAGGIGESDQPPETTREKLDGLLSGVGDGPLPENMVAATSSR